MIGSCVCIARGEVELIAKPHAYRLSDGNMVSISYSRMKLHGKQQRDDAGFAIELVRRTIMSHPPHEEWEKALYHLNQAQDILKRTGFYSDDFDPRTAAY